MHTTGYIRQRRQLISLTLRISLGLICAALVPLAVIFAFISVQTIPALIEQTNTTLTNDARNRVQLIDTYLKERLLDLMTEQQASSQIPSIQLLLTQDQPGSADFQLHARDGYYALSSGFFRDKNYASWQFFDISGHMLLYYPTQNRPLAHGNALIPAPYLAAVTSGKTFLSSVYYSPALQKASIDFYAPVLSAASLLSATQQASPSANQIPPKVVGILRATLNLDYIWHDIVQNNLGNNGKGSYALITDENGIRIADTDAQHRFTSVAPLTSATRQAIQQEARYGSSAPVPLLADSALATSMNQHTALETFQSQPAGRNEPFQIVRLKTSVVPWSYFVLSPISTVTAVAGQQQLEIALVALITFLSVATIGLFVGRRISFPILRAVEYLRRNSQTLSELATSQKNVATEHMWVADSSQVGLQSITYYAEAAKVASDQLYKTTQFVAEHWQQTDDQGVNYRLAQISSMASYIVIATTHQFSSNQKLATALKVSTQVTEQLHLGATSATETAKELELVVKELRAVVGQ